LRSFYLSYLSFSLFGFYTYVVVVVVVVVVVREEVNLEEFLEVIQEVYLNPI